ncbi:MAG: hypothetical protein COB71_08060 [Thiotrichales bacterium]|nr:MAG: hypothetical protein COB71_08060 [Thiotrichales bacterium]
MRSVADSLALGIANQNDLETVRDGEPAYLLLIDGFILNDPDNEDLLLAGARLYDTYAGIFVEDKQRAARLSDKARDYARRALCQPYPTVCRHDKGSYDGFSRAITQVDGDELALLYGYATAWAGWVQAHSHDFRAIAELPKIELAFEQIIKFDPAYERGQAQLYLGVLRTLRPPALGGKPEVGRQHFENAIKYSDGRNLYAKVEFARRYARLIFDQELHDKLLNEVMDAAPEERGLTLNNTLAQQQARQLLDSSAAYFEE